MLCNTIVALIGENLVAHSSDVARKSDLPGRKKKFIFIVIICDDDDDDTSDV